MFYLVMGIIFVLVALSTWWFGLWNNIITFCNFLIAAMVASGLRDMVNDLFDFVDEGVAQFADLLTVWGLFVLTTVVLRSATDTLSRVRLRFHPAMELVGRIFVCGALSAGFTLFVASTIPYIDFRNSRAASVQESGPSFLVTGYESSGLKLWADLVSFWDAGPFSD